tara:strand:+ start:1030 stop:1242 length:213 start_codon:yes stop_codon:yes gene_type:complete
MSNRWLEQVKEEIIDPERPIIDPHHHLWRDERTSKLFELVKRHTGMKSMNSILNLRNDRQLVFSRLVNVT